MKLLVASTVAVLALATPSLAAPCAGAAAVSGSVWEGLARAAGNGPSAKSRLEVIRAAAPVHCFSMDQVRFLMETLSSQAALRVDALAALHGRLTEPHRFAEFYAMLTAEQADALSARIAAASAPPPGPPPGPPPWAGPPLGPPGLPPSTSEVCYQVSTSSTRYSRTPELLCVAPRGGDKTWEIVMKTGFPNAREIARFSLTLLQQSPHRTKNKNHFGVLEAENSAWNTLAIRFDGVRDETGGDEHGSVSIGKTRLYYRTAR